MVQIMSIFSKIKYRDAPHLCRALGVGRATLPLAVIGSPACTAQSDLKDEG